MAASSRHLRVTSFAMVLTAALAAGPPAPVAATESPHRQRQQTDPPPVVIDSISDAPKFYLRHDGDYLSVGVGAGTVGSSLRGVDGSVDEREFRMLVLGRAGTRWRYRLAVAVELTGWFGHHNSVAITRDSSFRSAEAIPELEIAGAVVFCYTISPEFPLALYGGPVCGVVWTWFDASLVGGEKYSNVSSHSAALGYVAGAGFDWQWLARRTATVFVRYQRTYNRRYLYERLAPDLEARDRWSLMGGLGLTFNFN